MIKRNPSSRNQRSKGFKVKHVLQAILLLGVCFWLIYQVKHNHDKKKEFDKNDTKLPIITETDQILKLGRKDLLPGKVEADKNEKHEEEEEDEHIVYNMQNKHEHDEQQQEGEEGNKHETEEESEDNVHEGREEHDEEDNKHGAKEQEENESKSEEVEDEGGDVEIDENDHEKSEADNDRDDEVVDEEKDKEEEGDDETENEDKEDEEKGGLVENHDNHEAREEHYKADDASSAVAHDARETSTETSNLEHADLNLQINTRKPENETTHHSDESNRSQNDSDLKVTEGELTDGISSNATAGKEAGNDSLSNETAKTNPDSQLDLSSNLTAVITDASSNLTGTGDDTSSSSGQIKAMILSESDHAQNATVNTTITGDIKQTDGLEQSGSKISEGNLPGNDSIVSVKPENGVAAPEKSSTLGASALEKMIGSVASNETVNVSSNLDRNASSDTTESDKSKGSTETSEVNETQNTDATEDEMFKGDTQTSETDGKSDTSSVTEILDSIEHDTIDSSDTQNIHEDMAKARTDLDTLPDIRNEGNDSDENAAE